MKRFVLLTTLLLTLLSGLAESPLAQANVTSNSHQVTASHLMTTTMPLMFMEQQPNRYQVQLNGQSMWFTEDSMWLTTQQQNIKLTFQDTNLQARIEPINKLETHISTFRGNDPAKWQTDIPVYDGVRYRNLYPNTDLIITSEQGKLAWQWETVVGAGLVPAHVADSQTGQAQGLPLPGNIRVSVDNGHTPTTHTLDPNQNLTDQLAAIIDPQTPDSNANTNPHMPRQQGAADLVWSTFFGGTGRENWDINDIAVDNLGNIYVVSFTDSANFPTTAGAIDTSYNSGTTYDTFVIKLTSNGSLVYSTFIGGSSTDEGWDIAVDKQGNAYITGATWSTDFPTTPGAFDRTFVGGNKPFITKINTNGTQLIYSTFLGGSCHGYGDSIAVDDIGNAYLTGNINCTDFPTTAGAFDTTYNGSIDAFVSKINTNGNALVYSTFLGSSSTDFGHSITLDNSGNAYIAGFTGGSEFPVTTGAFDTSYNGGDYDAFVVKLNSNGSSLAYATFLGGNNTEGVNIYGGISIAVDSSNNAYVGGVTWSNNFPTTSGVFDTSYNGNSDFFATKLNSTGSSLIYSTYIGGTGNEHASQSEMVIDGIGNAYIGGNCSSDFPMVVGSFDTTSGDGVNACVVTELMLV